MDTPPFRLARSQSGQQNANALHPLHDLCCEPAPAAHPAAHRRTRLTELDSHLYCSVIGTCLSTAELRKLVPRFTALDRERATDLQIHHAAVELTVQGGDGAKALHKALDHRYALAIKRFGSAKDIDALRELWADALKTGDIPPAYWAVITHPSATPEIRQLAFGDVHMLSHLVGAANRADIRRLVELEAENAALRDKIDRQQNRLQTFAIQHDATVRELDEKTGVLSALASKRPQTDDEGIYGKLARLRSAVAERDERIALHASRCDAADDRLKAEQARVQTLRDLLADALETLEAMEKEATAMEQAMRHSVASEARPALERVRGTRIVYVGGRPGSNVVIKQLVESAGGWLITHDGGLEDRKGMLPALIPGADVVVFPVDCIDHDSMNTLKRICDRHQVAYYPLRTASVASFVELMTRQQPEGERPSACPPASAFCLRHG